MESVCAIFCHSQLGGNHDPDDELHLYNLEVKIEIPCPFSIAATVRGRRERWSEVIVGIPLEIFDFLFCRGLDRGHWGHLARGRAGLVCHLSCGRYRFVEG